MKLYDFMVKEGLTPYPFTSNWKPVELHYPHHLFYVFIPENVKELDALFSATDKADWNYENGYEERCVGSTRAQRTADRALGYIWMFADEIAAVHFKLRFG